MTFLFNIGFIEVGPVDIIDIALVSILFYQLYRLIEGSVARNILFGIVSVYIVYVLVDFLNLNLLSSILGQFMGIGVLASLILFQQEIRKFLVYIGKSTSLKNLFHLHKHEEGDYLELNTIVKAAKELSVLETGALIVLSKSDELRFYIDTGDIIDAKINKRLLISIFNKTSPLHDGAVIISGNRIIAARCIIPVTEKEDLPAQYGLRHRAAIGLTEATDSLVLVVSEETGNMSLAIRGEIMHDLTTSEIRAILNKEFYTQKALIPVIETTA